jgi:hypothetical protein
MAELFSMALLRVRDRMAGVAGAVISVEPLGKTRSGKARISAARSTWLRMTLMGQHPSWAGRRHANGSHILL